MQETLHKLKSSRFLRNAAVLSGGSLAGQLIVIISSPLLTRLYTPSDFGLLGVFASILAMVSIVASLRFELAIPLPEDESTALRITGVSFASLLCTTLLASMACILFADEITRWLNAPDFKNYIFLVPIGMFILGLYQILNSTAVRAKAFSSIARTRVMQGAMGTLVQLGLGLVTKGSIGLLIGQVTGQAAGTLTLLATLPRPTEDSKKIPRISGLLHTAKRYIKFPLLGAPSALLNSAGLQLPPILLTAFYGPEAAGFFMLGKRVLSAPLEILNRAVGQVFLSESATLVHKDLPALQRLVLRTATRLFALGLVPILLIAGLAPFLVTWVFGAEWREAGMYLSALAVMFIAQITVGPVSHIFVVLERQGYALGLNLIKVVITIVSFLAVSRADGEPVIAVLTYAVGMAIYYVAVLVWSVIAIQRELQVRKVESRV